MNWPAYSVVCINECLRHFMNPWTREWLTAWPQIDIPPCGYAAMPQACFKSAIPVCNFTRQRLPCHSVWLTVF
jgi:hypothetical protein